MVVCLKFYCANVITQNGWLVAAPRERSGLLPNLFSRFRTIKGLRRVCVFIDPGEGSRYAPNQLLQRSIEPLQSQISGIGEQIIEAGTEEPYQELTEAANEVEEREPVQHSVRIHFQAG